MTSINRTITKGSTIGPFGQVVAKSAIIAICACIAFGLISSIASVLLQRFGAYAEPTRWVLTLGVVLAIIWDVWRTDMNKV